MNLFKIETLSDIANFQKDLSTTEYIILDIETNGLDCFSNDLLLIQLKLNDNYYYVEYQFADKKLVYYLLDLIDASGKKVIGFNIKFDMKFILSKLNILLRNVICIMYTEVILENGIGKRFYSLPEIVSKYLDIEMSKDVRNDFIDFPKESHISQQMIEYGLTDVSYLDEIFKKQSEFIHKDRLEEVLDLEMKLLPVVCSMENEGISLNKDLWSELANNAKKEYASLEKKIKENILLSYIDTLDKDLSITEICDNLKIRITTKREKTALDLVKDYDNKKEIVLEKFNLNSNAQLKNLLNLVGVPVKDVSEKTLKKLINQFSFLEDIISYKDKAKAISSFGEGFFDYIHPKTGKIHATANQLMAQTGRFSYSNPNLQQIKHDSKYREAFYVEDGYKIIAADYSQQELRLFASLTREPKLIEAFVKGIDPHSMTASIVFEKDIAEITPDERSIGKAVNFAIIYGTTSMGMAYNFSIPLKDAEKFLNKFWLGYNIAGYFVTEVKNKIIQNYYTRTPIGRIRRFEQQVIFKDRGDYYRHTEAVKRKGFNTIVQGCGADIVKYALVNMFNNNPFGDKFKIILTVHDEILVKVSDDIVEPAKDFVIKIMEDVEQIFLGEIPAKVDGKVSTYWKH